jgi:RNA polymerase sigma-19 factor, ECF subfamily
VSSLEWSGTQALHGLYNDHARWLRDWLRRRLGCVDDAADLAHDTFLRVATQTELTAIREPRAYLTTVAHGILVNHIRRRDLERAYLAALAALPAAQVPDPESQALLFETLVEIDAVLTTLPAKVRRAFLLAQLDGWSHAEIASELGVSISSVKQYMVRAVALCLTLPR